MGKSGMDKRIFEAIASTVKAGRANSNVESLVEIKVQNRENHF